MQTRTILFEDITCHDCTFKDENDLVHVMSNQTLIEGNLNCEGKKDLTSK